MAIETERVAFASVGLRRRAVGMLAAAMAMVVWPLLLSARPAAAADYEADATGSDTFLAFDGTSHTCNVFVLGRHHTDTPKTALGDGQNESSGDDDCEIFVRLTLTYTDQNHLTHTVLATGYKSAVVSADNAASAVHVTADIFWTQCDGGTNPSSCSITLAVAPK